MLDKFHDLLREHGRSVTKSRTRLFQYLQKQGPVTMAQFMTENAAIADRASLYRALGMFRELGVIEDRIITGRRLLELTDEYDSHHHHMTCTWCGKSIAFTLEHLEQDLTQLCRQHGFEAETHTIEISGVCVDCRRR